MGFYLVINGKGILISLSVLLISLLVVLTGNTTLGINRTYATFENSLMALHR